jgi:Flp pilus assembly pilin Flp
MNVCKEFIKNEDGMGVVEIILIIVVLIGIVILFSAEINELVASIFKTINSKVKIVN